MTPVTTPIAAAPIGSTNAHAGVIATRPATAPEAAPSEVEWPLRSFSNANQPTRAAPAATCVLSSASPAIPFAASADPALNPNQPNHKSPEPSITSGSECGRIESRRHPTRFPSTRASASPAAPALMCTAVPPAKSSRPLPARNPVPVTTSPTLFPNANTQCATGK